MTVSMCQPDPNSIPLAVANITYPALARIVRAARALPEALQDEILDAAAAEIGHLSSPQVVARLASAWLTEPAAS